MANSSTPITIQDLLTAYSGFAPVSTAEGVSNAISWFNIVEVYALMNGETTPNANTIIFACEESARNTEVMDTDYAKVNNYLYHIRCMLYAITQQTQ